MRDALAIGAITDLQALAADLSRGNSADAALGRKIGALASGFDFEGLSELATSLEAGQDGYAR